MNNYNTKTSKVLDFYCNEKGIKWNLMTEKNKDDFVEWLSEKYLTLRTIAETAIIS